MKDLKSSILEFIKFIYIPAFILLLSVSCNAAKLNNSILNVDTSKQTDDNFQKAKGSKRIVSYNVKHCEGMDNVIDFDRIAKIVNSLNPDIVCIQELDSMTTRSNIYQANVLGDKFGMHSYFGSAIPYKGGKYGIGVFSKEKPVRTYHYSLPGVEKRTFLMIEFPTFIVICVHLDLTESNRIASVKIITDKAKKFNKKIYLAGDLNENDRNGKVFSEFMKDWDIISEIKNTFPTGAPTRCIDYILSFKQEKLKYQLSNKNVVYSLLNVDVSIASDHYPIFIDFK
jgi:endonuclease/exonuclease/phosphatase family metal-dependent hydrolase